MSLMEIHVPDIGDFKEVEVIELLVKPGDTVKPEQSLITGESDKASMEIPCTHAGIVKELKVKIGDKVAEGSLLLVLEVSQDTASATPPAKSAAPVVASAPAAQAAPTARTLQVHRVGAQQCHTSRNDQQFAHHGRVFCQGIRQPEDRGLQLLGQNHRRVFARGQQRHCGDGVHLPIVCR